MSQEQNNHDSNRPGVESRAGDDTAFDQRGQNIHGDQYNIAGNIIQQRLDPADLRNQRNHAVLRQAVRRFWVDGVLKGSLYNEVCIRLGLDARPEAVDNRPWKLTLHQMGQPDRTIPDDKEIVDIFDEMGQQLLILGEPGSGKTTTLLTLADELLIRTEKEPTLPTPVVFNLSSWAEKQPKIEEWLVDELKTRYQMPNKVAKGWVENDELLLLFDGLDEVAEAKRNDCVTSINAFRQEHAVCLAVCSRTTEYAALQERLKLVGAIGIRPLTTEQIEAYIEQAGPQVSALNTALAESEDLRELARTPLMLSVMTLAYQEQNAGDTEQQAAGHTIHQQLFDRYIRRMFQHREIKHTYSANQTLQSLSWLAKEMASRSQTIFLMRKVKSDWLRDFQVEQVYLLVAGATLVFTIIISFVFSAVVAFVAFGFRGFSIIMILFAGFGGLGIFIVNKFILQVVLRIFLWHQGHVPIFHRQFFDLNVERLFLRCAGSGYVFVHHTLMEHFASLTDEDIERITAGLEQE